MDIEKNREFKKKNQYERYLRRRKAKMESTLEAALGKVKDKARTDTWSSVHKNCFRYSPYPAESDWHVQVKLQRHMYWRNKGATVFTEMRWKNGTRSDLVVCTKEGEVFIEEIVCSEKEASLVKKAEKYPFPLHIIQDFMRYPE